MTISARNQIEGSVKAVTLGNVMAEVVVDIGGGREMVAAITRGSAEAMGIREGERVRVVIKSTDVMIEK